MATEYENLSLSTLNSMLKENRRLQAVNESESPWQGQTPYSKLVYALNKGDRTRKLKREEEALLIAIQKNEKALRDREKAEADAKAITDQMNAALKGVNVEMEKEGGLINDLTNRIAELEKKKLLPESSREDIAKYNDEIKRLNEELDELQNLSLEGMSRKIIEPLEKLPAIKAPALEVDMGGLKPVVSQYQQQMAAIFDVVRNGLYGWADSSSAYLMENAADTVAIVQNYTETLMAKGYNFESALQKVYSEIQKVREVTKVCFVSLCMSDCYSPSKGHRSHIGYRNTAAIWQVKVRTLTTSPKRLQ